jgi:hypothetical protein
MKFKALPWAGKTIFVGISYANQQENINHFGFRKKQWAIFT